MVPADVEVWVVDTAAREADPLAELLSAAERERRDGFATPQLRRRFAVAHGLVRAVLGRALGADPAAIAFEEGPHGKPRAVRDAPAPDVRFSLSHSADLAAVALATGVEVGLDLEWGGRTPDVDRLAPTVLAGDEHAALAALPAGERRRAFLDAWTRKEAVLKAAGEGVLRRPLASVRVELGPGARFATELDGHGRFEVADARVADGFSGAVAAAGALGAVRTVPWS